MLTALAGADRALLTSRGEFHEGVRSRAVAPMAADSAGSASSLVATLPLDEPDPLRRLDLVVAETRARKREPMSIAGAGALSSSFIGRVAVRVAAHQRLATHYVGNVPGPRDPLYVGPARVLEVFPLVPIMGNMTIGIGALSYTDQFAITVVADRAACPDLEVFAAGMRDTLGELGCGVSTTEGA